VALQEAHLVPEQALGARRPDRLMADAWQQQHLVRPAGG